MHGYDLSSGKHAGPIVPWFRRAHRFIVLRTAGRFSRRFFPRADSLAAIWACLDEDVAIFRHLAPVSMSRMNGVTIDPAKDFQSLDFSGLFAFRDRHGNEFPARPASGRNPGSRGVGGPTGPRRRVQRAPSRAGATQGPAPGHLNDADHQYDYGGDGYENSASDDDGGDDPEEEKDPPEIPAQVRGESKYSRMEFSLR